MESDRLLYAALEGYASYLSFVSRQPGLVALFAAFLPSARRIRCYSRLLLFLSSKLAPSWAAAGAGAGTALSSSSSAAAEAAALEAMQAARRLLPETDVAEIVRVVSDPALAAALAHQDQDQLEQLDQLEQEAEETVAAMDDGSAAVGAAAAPTTSCPSE
jgi:hypothetical protein